MSSYTELSISTSCTVWREPMCRPVTASHSLVLCLVEPHVPLQERRMRFEMAVKRYVFHFWPVQDPPVAPAPETKTKLEKSASSYVPKEVQEQVAHYGCCVHEVRCHSAWHGVSLT